MYAQHFGLRCLPFEDRPDPQFYFATPDRDEALAAMECQTQHGSGIGLTLGEAGAGKSTLIREFLRKLPAATRAIVITCSPGDDPNLMRQVCEGFGLTPPASSTKSQLAERLRRRLQRAGEKGTPGLIVIDQAEHLTETGLADLAMLSELRHGTDRLLTLLICAQPQFLKALAAPEFSRLRQELYGERTILPLSPERTAEYIRRRLHAAGAVDAAIFEPAAQELIHRHSRGLPRLINKLCDAAMLAAYGADVCGVTTTIVEELIRGDVPEHKSKDLRDLGLTHAGEVIHGLTSRRDVTPGGLPSMPTTDPSPVDRSATNALASANADFAAAPCVERQVAALETRIERASNIALEVERQAHRAASVCERAEEITSRLSSFADQLADRADELQRRINQLLGNVASAQEAESRLTEVIDRSGAACSETDQRLAALTRQAETTLDSQAVQFNARLERTIQDSRARVDEAVASTEASIHTAVNRVEAAAQEQARRTAAMSRELAARLTAIEGQYDRAREGVASLAERQAATESSAAATQETIGRVDGRIRELRAHLGDLDKAAQRIYEATLAVDAPLALRAGQADDLLQKTATACERARDAHGEITAGLVEVGGACERVQAARRQAEECREIVERFSFAADSAEKVAERVAVQADAADRARAAIEQAVARGASCADNLELRTQAAVDAGQGLAAASSEGRDLIGLLHDSATAAGQAAAEASDSGERLRQSHSQAEKTARTVADQTAAATKVRQALEMLMHGADEKLARLGSYQAAATSVLERLTDSIRAAHQTVRQAESVRRISAGLSEQIEQGQAHHDRLAAQHTMTTEAANALEASLQTAADVAAGLQDRIAQAIESSGGLALGCDRADQSRQQLERGIAIVVEARQSLDASAQEAANERGQLAHVADHAAAVRRQIDQTATELVTSYEQVAREAGSTIERASGQLVELHESQHLMGEAALHVKQVREQLDALQAQADQLGHLLTDLGDEPKRVLESARSQTAELERVLAAVRKVFTGLSQASLQAKRQADELSAKGQTASHRISQLAATHHKATKTLSQWVAEAIRVQTRLESVLLNAPSIEETHPSEGLAELADLTHGALSDDPPTPSRSRSPRVTSPRSVPTRAVPVRPDIPNERAEQIASILQDARQAPAG